MARKTNMGIRKSTAEIIFEICNYTILGIIALSMLYPFIYVLAISLNDANDSQLGGIWLYPRVFSLESYTIVFNDPTLLDALLVSVGRTVLGTVLTVMGCATFAYVFTRNEFVFYKPMKGFFFFAMFFGGGGLIPTFMLYRDLGLVDSFWVYIIPSIINLWYVTLFRTYFRSIPNELLEAARIDGCGFFKCLFKVMLPNSVSGITTAALFSFLGHWKSYQWPLIVTNSTNLRTLPIGLKYLVQESSSEYQVMMAAALMTVVPVLIVYSIYEKQLVKSITLTGIK